MRFAADSRAIRTVEGEFDELLCRAGESLEGASVDLAFIFFSSHFEDDAASFAEHIRRVHPRALTIGCSAEGVIGGGQEHERVPGVAVMLASLPGVRIKPFHISVEQMQGAISPEAWRERVGVDLECSANFIFLGDPFTVPISPVLRAFDAAYPGRPLLGGMASGCERPQQSALLIGDQVFREGCGGIALSGPLRVYAVVSQGCRPIGHPLVITQGEKNIIRTLGGHPALQQLRDIVDDLSDRDAALAKQALFIGRAITEYKETFTRGDFLVRHLMGYDPESGAIAVGDEIRVGATVQFQIRDADSADEDLRQMLAGYCGEQAPAGILMFSCNGRGTRMWPEPNHDVSTAREVCGDVPVAGFFAAGEIGPVGGRNFIHGHTASMAIFKNVPATGK
jgi:small ligand-binding sensory domain FIST